MQNREITAVILPEPVNADPVHTTGTSILPNPLPCPPKIARVIDLPDQRVRLPHLHTLIHYLARHGAIPSILTRRRLGHCLGNHQSDAAYSLDTNRAPTNPASAVRRGDKWRSFAELTAEHHSIGHDLERPPDKVLAFVVRMPLLYGDDTVPASGYVCPMHPEVTRPNRRSARSAG